MKVAIVACAGFNELDAFALLYIINRASRVQPAPGITAELCCATATVRSMHGVVITGVRPLSFAREADAVLIGSGGTLNALADAAFMAELQLDPARQLIGSQCSGALFLARLGLLEDATACIDDTYRTHLQQAGVTPLDQPFHARGNVATAGGCLASPYLAGWVIWRLLGVQTAEAALAAVAPVGRADAYVSEAMAAIRGG
jgi:transcriptional regulator GlxA family with amidase domain